MAKKRFKKLSKEAIEVLRASTICGNRLYLPSDDIDCYAHIKECVEALGGRWNNKTGSHDFPMGADVDALLSSVFETGLPPTNVNDFFPTPPSILDRIFEEPDVSERIHALIRCAKLDGDAVRFLEPSAGHAAIANRVRDLLEESDEMTLIEYDPANVAVLKEQGYSPVQGDFLEFKASKPFDLVVMNPPFAGRTWWYHVQHAWNMLNDQGLLIAVIPTSGIQGNSPQCTESCRFFLRNGDIYPIEGQHFEGTTWEVTIVAIQKSEAGKWRQPCDGYSTLDAFQVAMTIEHSREHRTRLAAAKDKDGVLSLFRAIEQELLEVECAAQVTDDEIVEIVSSLAHSDPQFSKQLGYFGSMPETEGDESNERPVAPVHTVCEQQELLLAV